VLYALLRSTPPPTATYTLSLHDALPIYHLLESFVQHLDRDVRHAARAVRRPGAAVHVVIGAHRSIDERKQIAQRTILRERCDGRSEEHTSELQSRENLVCRLLLEKKKQQ